MHVNTLRQRLDRIESVTGLALDAQDLLALQLAIKLARLSKRQARAVIERVATAADGTGPQDGSDESHSRRCRMR